MRKENPLEWEREKSCMIRKREENEWKWPHGVESGLGKKDLKYVKKGWRIMESGRTHRGGQLILAGGFRRNRARHYQKREGKE